MKKGFTLIEVIVAIALIGILAVSFLPTITFGFVNLIKSQKYTIDTFASQKDVENIIEEKRKSAIAGTDELNIFGVKVKGHIISEPVSTHGEINFFKPNFQKKYPTPELIANGHTGIPNIVLLTKDKTTTPSDVVNMFNSDGTLNNVIFTADGSKYKVKDNTIHLMNVYRWYTSSEVGYPNVGLQNYLLIKEWNAARGLISYEESNVSNFIPNIQNDPITNQPNYNKFTFKEVKDGLALSNEKLINIYGNRYLYYSVTPYAVSGKIGKEYTSNAIYVNAPRIEIESAKFIIGNDTVTLKFKDPVKGPFVQEKMNFNESLGDIVSIDLSADGKRMSIKFSEAITNSEDIEGNVLYKGAVSSVIYDAISIWSLDNKPSGEFKIVKQTPIKEWNFTDHTEGWNANADINNFGHQAGGYIGGNISGIDPNCSPSETINIHTDNINKIQIRLKNSTTSSMAEIYFQTSEGVMDENRTLKFPITPNSDFIEYTLDVSTAPYWSGMLQNFRIDPVTNVTSGSFSIDYVRFYE